MVISPFQLIYSLMLTCLNDLLERGLSILLLLTFHRKEILAGFSISTMLDYVASLVNRAPCVSVHANELYQHMLFIRTIGSVLPTQIIFWLDDEYNAL